MEWTADVWMKTIALHMPEKGKGYRNFTDRQLWRFIELVENHPLKPKVIEHPMQTFYSVEFEVDGIDERNRPNDKELTQFVVNCAKQSRFRNKEIDAGYVPLKERW